MCLLAGDQNQHGVLAGRNYLTRLNQNQSNYLDSMQEQYFESGKDIIFYIWDPTSYHDVCITKIWPNPKYMPRQIKCYSIIRYFKRRWYEN